MLVVDGEPVALDEHLRRIEVSLDALYSSRLPARAPERIEQAAAGHELARLRLTATPVRNGEPEIEVTALPISAEIVLPGWESGLDLESVTVDGWRGAHKWADRRLLEGLEGSLAPATPLIVDAAGVALETPRANLFAVWSDGELRTPPTDGAILPGVTRARVIALAERAGIHCRQAPLTLDALTTASEMFLTGSVRGVEAVRSLDGRPLDGPGELTSLIAGELGRAWLRR